SKGNKGGPIASAASTDSIIATTFVSPPVTQTRPRLARLNGWYCPAVDCVFGARNGFGTGRGQKRDEIGDFFRFCRTAERYPAKAVHDDLLSTLIICASLFCETLRQADGRDISALVSARLRMR